MTGASYLRTIYTFEVETTPEQDATLIRTLNDRSNRQRWNLVTANCADFARQVLSLYYPHSVHRSIIGDLGVTTPKQLARTLTNYSRRHPELQPASFVIPQVPGTIPRSKRVKGVFEVMLTAKKYMLPIFIFHPYAASAAVAVYVQHWHFNPGKNAPILDSNRQLSAAMTPSDRRTIQGQLEELVRTASSRDGDADSKDWASIRVTAEPGLDSYGAPTLQVQRDGEVQTVGVARSNILDVPARFGFRRQTCGGAPARGIEVRSNPQDSSCRRRERSGTAAATAGAANTGIGKRLRPCHGKPELESGAHPISHSRMSKVSQVANRNAGCEIIDRIGKGTPERCLCGEMPGALPLAL